MDELLSSFTRASEVGLLHLFIIYQIFGIPLQNNIAYLQYVGLMCNPKSHTGILLNQDDAYPSPG